MVGADGKTLPFTSEDVGISITIEVGDNEPDYFKIWEQIKKQIDVGFCADKQDWLMESHGDINFDKTLSNDGDRKTEKGGDRKDE